MLMAAFFLETLEMAEKRALFRLHLAMPDRRLRALELTPTDLLPRNANKKAVLARTA